MQQQTAAEKAALKAELDRQRQALERARAAADATHSDVPPRQRTPFSGNSRKEKIVT